MKWCTPIMKVTPLPLPDLQAWARARRTEVRISVLESYNKVKEARLVAECGRRVSWRERLRYVNGQFMVSVELETTRAPISDPIKALFVERLRPYITDVVPVTDDEVLTSFAAVHGTFPTLAYSESGAGPWSKASGRECHPFE